MGWAGLTMIVGTAAATAGWGIVSSWRRPGVRRGTIAELGDLVEDGSRETAGTTGTARTTGTVRKVRSRRAAAANSEPWVEIAGRVSNGADRIAPISGRKVVGYRVLVEHEVGPLGWRTIVDLDEWPELEVSDASGSAFVRVQGGRLVVECTRGRGGPFRGIPQPVARLLRAHGHPTHGVLFEKAFRWREETLLAGEAVRVRGFMKVRPDGAPLDYRRLAMRRALVGSTARPVVVCST
jgi:hypothetical protein